LQKNESFKGISFKEIVAVQIVQMTINFLDEKVSANFFIARIVNFSTKLIVYEFITWTLLMAGLLFVELSCSETNLKQTKLNLMGCHHCFCPFHPAAPRFESRALHLYFYHL